MESIIECVPNFSEGRDPIVIDQIANEIRKVQGVRLLHVDSGFDANRTVMTFVGNPLAVTEAAFNAIKKASELIDMRVQKGEHPRFGSTDVCPLIPISGISMNEVVSISKQLGERIGRELGVHVYLYEESATATHRKNLAACRKGEYEGLSAKMTHSEWIPDFGPLNFNVRNGAVALGARRFLVAFNVNLNTKSVDVATQMAKVIRESGGWFDVDGERMQRSGRLTYLKAIGWYMQHYECAQVSMNLTNIEETPLHLVFSELEQIATEFGVEITGSELIGMIPKEQLLGVAHHLCQISNWSELSERDAIVKAAERLKIHVPQQFDPNKQVLEYLF